jgi:hypothetical protein
MQEMQEIQALFKAGGPVEEFANAVGTEFL